jgi:hypothetical protein
VWVRGGKGKDGKLDFFRLVAVAVGFFPACASDIGPFA